MLDEYLALGGVELGNNARAYAYASCLSCCAGLLKGGTCDGIHDATNSYTNAVYEWQEVGVNLALNPAFQAGDPVPSNVPSSATVTVSTTTDDPYVGDRSMRLTAATTDGLSIPVTTFLPDAGETYTLLMLVRPVGKPLTLSPRIRATTGSPVTIPADQWSEVRYTGVAGTGNNIQTGATVSASNGHDVGDIIDVGAVILTAGENDLPFYDGSNLPEGSGSDQYRVSWLGEENASASLLEEYVLLEAATSDEPPYTCNDIARAPWYDPTNPFSHDFAGFYLLSVKGITDGTMTAGVTESIGGGGVIGASHYATRSVRVRSMIVGCGNAAAEYGLAWLKAALGESFCSRHGDACGTSDLEFFIDCPPPLDPGEEDYGSVVNPYRRYLHDVACTSAPIIAEEYRTMSGAYVIIVEYILTAESPFVWGRTFAAENSGTVLTAYDDIPFNLMRRPSGEQGDGIPAVVATQYAFNGSAEYGGSGSVLPTGWSGAGFNVLMSDVTTGKSSDIAAVGPNSARVRVNATQASSSGRLTLFYDVPLATLPPGSAPSLSMWAAALIFAGSPTIGDLTAEVEWRTDTSSISVDFLGSLPINGGNISASGLTRPPTATVARMRVNATSITLSPGDDVRLYADAFGLTVP